MFNKQKCTNNLLVLLIWKKLLKILVKKVQIKWKMIGYEIEIKSVNKKSIQIQ